MRTFNKHIISLFLIFVAVGCIEEDFIGQNPANSGDDVKFGVSLSKLDTRTTYGKEDNNAFPIYWVNGDQVRVAAPQCAVDEAVYQVSVSGPEQKNADDLTKVTPAGIQWGANGWADFYSIYPSNEGTTLSVNEDNTVNASFLVNTTQYASIDITGTKGAAYYAEPSEMSNVIMYAVTPFANSGDIVNLAYEPFSTVLEFQLSVPENQGTSSTNELTVKSISLQAPDNLKIAGEFQFNFPQVTHETDADGNVINGTVQGSPSISNIIEGHNIITVHLVENGQYTVSMTPDKNTLKVKMCLMPISGVTSLDGWTIVVNTNYVDSKQNGNFKMTVKNTGNTTKLEPGKVHKIKLPVLKYNSNDWTYDLDNWIPSLPDYRNIYLTEISIPGAWYAGSSESYQATTDMSVLWNAGVRAFACECRSFTTRSWSISEDSPSRVCLSGTGTNSGGAYTSNLIGGGPTYISSIISQVASSITSDEFGVLVLSYADGGSGGHRALDYSNFINLIQTEILQSGATNIYSDTIDENTIVDEVLGKLIIKVNVDNNLTVGSYANASNVLFSYNPFLKQLDAASYSNPQYSNLYWRTWNDSYKKLGSWTNGASGFWWCFTSANRTQTDTNNATGLPTYTQRQAALLAIMDRSKEIYDLSTHNVWFYFNAGGTEATSSETGNPSPTNFARKMNPWLLQAIKDKIAEPEPSSLGLVMFNQCTGDNATYRGADIIKEIIEMNSKFYLKHHGDGTGTTDPVGLSAARGYSAGVKDSGADVWDVE